MLYCEARRYRGELAVSIIEVGFHLRNRAYYIAEIESRDSVSDTLHGSRRFIAQSRRQFGQHKVVSGAKSRISTVHTDSADANSYVSWSRWRHVEILNAQHCCVADLVEANNSGHVKLPCLRSRRCHEASLAQFVKRHGRSAEDVFRVFRRSGIYNGFHGIPSVPK